MAWQCTPAFVIERDLCGAREILYVMERPSRQSGAECAFRDALDVEVCETGNGLSEGCVKFFIFYIRVGQFRLFSDESCSAML